MPSLTKAGRSRHISTCGKDSRPAGVPNRRTLYATPRAQYATNTALTSTTNFQPPPIPVRLARAAACMAGCACSWGVVGGTPATRRWADLPGGKVQSGVVAAGEPRSQPLRAALAGVAEQLIRDHEHACRLPETSFLQHRLGAHRMAGTRLEVGLLHRIVAPPGGSAEAGKGHLRRVKMALADVGRGMRKQGSLPAR